MPRFLSIWLDFTDQVSKDHTERQNKVEMDKINSLVNTMVSKLPLYYFYTAFSQLASRICHPNKDTWTVLQTIIIKLIYHHPQQSLWWLVSNFKSSNNNRVKRCNEIFADKRLMGEWMQKLIREFYSLADNLLELNAKNVNATIVKVHTQSKAYLVEIFNNILL